jgi:Holliday junction resolvasome RuvABC endonuclease subunit
MGIGSLTKEAKEIRTVLGIDASTNSLAFCLYGADGPIKWGEIKFSGRTTWERLADGQSKMDEVRDLSPDLIVFESAVFVQNKKTVVLLAYSFGALVAAIMGDGKSVEEIPPVTWQHAINNKPFTKDEKAAVAKENPGKSASWLSNKIREMRKQRTMDWVENNYGIKAENDNISDAIAIAYCGWKKFAS